MGFFVPMDGFAETDIKLGVEIVDIYFEITSCVVSTKMPQNELCTTAFVSQACLSLRFDLRRIFVRRNREQSAGY